MTTVRTTPLQKLLGERLDSRVLRIFGEHVERQKNSYCQLQEIKGKEVVIDGRRLINFNTINYLGLESHPRLIEAAKDALDRWGTLAGAARSAAEVALFETVEQRIADHLGVDNAIIFTTVALANHGVIPLMMRQGTLVLVDWEAHSCVQRAALEAKGAGADMQNFNHDDFEQLERILQENRGKYRHVMIALDGIYSMLGTYLDLPRYEELAAKHDATLFIDDAHGYGVIGPEGRGVVAHYGSGYDNIVYVGSLEKSLCSLGGFAIVPKAARDFFRYTCHTFIFSGQLPPCFLASALAAYDLLEEEGEALRGRLNSMIQHVKTEVANMGFELVGEDQPFPLMMVKVGDVYSVPKISQFFYDQGIHILTVGFPVIPLSRGAMVRISLSAAHTDEQIERLLGAFRKLREEVDLGC